ncbi:hypothetical protein, partial [Methylobacterium isbiliense]|uniref:hypothetical protein n=1 Tax=Methylobacterium isbiliense TaxID=315478 RepID=UPI0025B2D7AE
SRKRSFSTGRLLRRPHQHDADAPVDGFVTALHSHLQRLRLRQSKRDETASSGSTHSRKPT